MAGFIPTPKTERQINCTVMVKVCNTGGCATCKPGRLAALQFLSPGDFVEENVSPDEVKFLSKVTDGDLGYDLVVLRNGGAFPGRQNPRLF